MPSSKVSRRLVEAVKLHPERAYVLAWRAGMHPTVMSKLLHGAVRPAPGDRRVLAIAQVVGVPADQAFDAQTDSDEARVT